MAVNAVLPRLVAVVDTVIAGRLAGGPAKAGPYSSSDPAAVASAFPTRDLASQLIELTGPDGGNVGQVRAVRLQCEHSFAMSRAESVRRSSRVRVLVHAAARRAQCVKGLRLPIEAAQTLLRVST